MDLSVLTVTWNSKDYIEDQIQSVKNGYQNILVEHLIADNASADRTADILSKTKDVVFNPIGKNIGFSAANNLLAKEAKGRYFLLLNPDVKVSVGSLEALVKWADQHPQAGIIGVKLENENGEFNLRTAPRNFPGWFDQLVIILKLHHIFPSLLDTYLKKGFDPNAAQKVDSVQGSFMLVRRELYEQMGNLFDPRYFIWFEDVDLCREAVKRGFEVWYVPIVGGMDYAGKSFSQRNFFWKQKVFTKSMVQYFKKWNNPFWIFVYIFRPLVLMVAKVRDLFLKI